ncbi:hypothetical protein [Corynebacterium glyciniphilum]|uniref:hypothetical protein n=1 Tax=Corynebacterium glyciniphilum TaxID=1404244 RepID=UPI00265707ED|nr:hypothetical protein [Corynebacterium glyciniphilum]MDN6706397.1 hypothetical protein [Corynebacterium glyciniphilum]
MRTRDRATHVINETYADEYVKPHMTPPKVAAALDDAGLLDTDPPPYPQWPKYTVDMRNYESVGRVVMEVSTHLGNQKITHSISIPPSLLAVGGVFREECEKRCVRSIADDMADKAERVGERQVS